MAGQIQQKEVVIIWRPSSRLVLSKKLINSRLCSKQNFFDPMTNLKSAKTRYRVATFRLRNSDLNNNSPLYLFDIALWSCCIADSLLRHLKFNSMTAKKNANLHFVLEILQRRFNSWSGVIIIKLFFNFCC